MFEMKDIKVSICVPVYGGEKYIANCARSLFGQTYDNIEYVFVNDCTKDRSIEVVQQVAEEFPHRKSSLKIVNHEKNSGLAASRRTGVENATGDYFLYIDEDDYLEQDAIRQYVACAVETGADMVVADHNFVYQDKAVPHDDVVPDDKAEFVRRLLTRKSTIEVWGRLLRRSFVIENHLFAPDGLDLGEDYVIVPVMAYKAAKVAKVDAPLMNYVKYNTTSGSRVLSHRNLETIIKAMAILCDFFSNIPDAAEYAEALQQAKLYNKVTLYGMAAKEEYAFLRPLYPEVSVWKTPINIKYKLLLLFASWRWDSLVFRVVSMFKR